MSAIFVLLAAIFVLLSAILDSLLLGLVFVFDAAIPPTQTATTKRNR